MASKRKNATPGRAKLSKKFGKNQERINILIELISNIRSTKAELKITPKLFCDLSFYEKSGKLKELIEDNFNLIKQVGRVNQITKGKLGNTNSIDILILKEKISLTFKENVDITSQKERIMLKIESLKKQIDNLNKKLKNEGYIKNAPKDIVQGDKKLVKELTIEDAKLRSIVSSIN